MPSQEDIDIQLRLLAAHRRTLAHLLEQQATFSRVNTPPAVAGGITDARASIQQIKRALRTWGVQVDDLPHDGDGVPDEPPHDTIGRLHVAPVRSDAAWRLIVENRSDREILSIALTLRPPPSLFVSQTQFAIPRLAAHGRTETKPFTIVDPNAAPRSTPASSAPSVSSTRRVRLEQQRDRLDHLIAQAEADIDRLERESRLAAGRERLQREAEIRQFQEDKRRYEQELQTIEAQLERLTIPGDEATRQSAATDASEHPTHTHVSLHVLASYTIMGQSIERVEGDLLIPLT